MPKGHFPPIGALGVVSGPFAADKPSTNRSADFQVLVRLFFFTCILFFISSYVITTPKEYTCNNANEIYVSYTVLTKHD